MRRHRPRTRRADRRRRLDRPRRPSVTDPPPANLNGSDTAARRRGIRLHKARRARPDGGRLPAGTVAPHAGELLKAGKLHAPHTTGRRRPVLVLGMDRASKEGASLRDFCIARPPGGGSSPAAFFPCLASQSGPKRSCIELTPGRT